MKVNTNRITKLLFLFILLVPPLLARQSGTAAADSAQQSVAALKKVVSELKKITMTGFIQSQFQSSAADGVDSYAGGNFSAGMHNRFLIRRVQLKTIYDNESTRFVFQIESNGKNIFLKDAYAYVQDPWLKTFALRVGAFDRPFGFEIGYSSGKRESPERSRLIQTLFPNDADLGAAIEITPKSGPLKIFNFKGGLFAGNGINPEVDNQKDFIGRIGVHYPLSVIRAELDLGASGYFGKVKKPTGKTTYTVNSPVLCSANSVDEWANRDYMGFDLELTSAVPLLGSFSLRGEFISGIQPGFSPTSSSSPTALATDNLYLRNFMGYYLIYIQNLGESNRLVLKYDVYDPNRDVEGSQIGRQQTALLGSGDIKYSTFAIGWIYAWDANVSFTGYYEIVQNETTPSLVGYEKDIADNVFTLRMQYAF
jgi:phosphate-selective porin